MSNGQILWIAGGAVLLVAFFAVTAGGRDHGEAQARAAADSAKCRADLQCWGEKGLSRADAYCKSDVERLAQHSVRWTDEGMFERKFSRFRWLDKDAGTVTYIGDKAEFQNGFGAYTPVIYACDVGDLDQSRPKVLDARVIQEGRLPQ